MTTLTSQVFNNAPVQAWKGNINFNSDALKMALLSSSASPNLSTWVHYSDVTNEYSTANGYTATGVLLTGNNVATTAAASWSVSYSATAWSVGQIIYPGSGIYLMRCSLAGTSTSTPPTWPTTEGGYVVDAGGVGWTNIGTSATVLTTAAATWTLTGTLTNVEYGVLYDSTPSGASNQPLIALVTFSPAVNPTSGTFQITPDTNCGWVTITPF